jgi:hypothetical protein
MKRAVFGLGLVVFSLFARSASAGSDDEPPCSSEEKPSPEGSDKESEKDEKKDACRCRCRRKSDVELTVTGVRPSLTRVSTTGSTTNDLGVAFAGAADAYALKNTTHTQAQWVLGGGQAGFEGMLAGVIEFGYRLDVTEKTGPFGRVGLDGRIQGNDRLYFSSLELPRLALGWQFMSQKTVLEMGVRGGPILTGRFNPGDDGVRSISGSLEGGAFASIQFDFVRLEANAMRIDARKTGDHSPVDVGRAALCGLAGKVGICADMMMFRGTARFGGPPGSPTSHFDQAVATYAGLTVGVASW